MAGAEGPTARPAEPRKPARPRRTPRIFCARNPVPFLLPFASAVPILGPENGPDLGTAFWPTESGFSGAHDRGGGAAAAGDRPGAHRAMQGV